MERLGIDIGTSSCQFVLLDENNTVLWKKSFLHHNKVRDYILTTLGEIPGLTKDESVLLSVCGTMSHLTGLSSEYTASESLALSKAVSEYYPGIGSCIMIGAQNTLYMEPEDGKEPKIRRNSNCSAGTGSFFEEQAGRLGIKLEDISTLVEKAKSIPHIAGRCSVFSKTNMIHHMQEGTPTEDLLLGLCYSLVRNYKANILQNRDAKRPVLLLGGVMKNTGVVRAIKEQFTLSDSDIILDESSDYIPAIGC
ncbi:MAG: BadF/BadG/BcrA/BcrD ATPase family protein [Candidatus Alectryocaccobium sp.]